MSGIWYPDSPTELPDGRWVCGSHGLVVCGRCCVDYSFMDEVLDDAGGADPIEEYMRQNAKNEQLYEDLQAHKHREAFNLEDLGHKPVSRGVGAVIPRLFPVSSSDTLRSLFPPEFSPRGTPIVLLFIRRSEKDTFLIYTDGACLNNGQTWVEDSILENSASDEHRGR